MRALLPIALFTLVLVAPNAALAHRLIDANEAVTVAKSGLTVVPREAWNRLSQSPGSGVERWTKDGELLNDLLFFGEIEDGKALFREVDKRNSPLPRFASSMLLIDVPDFYGRSHRIAKGAASFELVSAEPAEFLGNAGVRFQFRTLGSDDIRRSGRAVATIIDGKLFMIAYEAPALHFFERHAAEFDQMVASARLQ